MAFTPITSWQTDGEKVKTVTTFIFLNIKVIVDGDCSSEIKRHLLPGRKVMTNLDSVSKSRGTRDQIANIRWIIKKSRESRKTSISSLLTMRKPLTVWITINCEKF